MLCFCSASQSCPTLCGSRDYSMPGFLVHHQLLELPPLSGWYHPTTSSSVVPFSYCLQSFPASLSFLMSWLFASDSQTIGASASASVLSMNIQDWFQYWPVWSHTDLMYVFISAITTIMWLPKHEGGRKEWENKSIQNML